LRASEIVKVSSHLVDKEDPCRIDEHKYAVCFAKLYRNNNSRRTDESSSHGISGLPKYLSIHDLSYPGEWVQVRGSDGETFLEACQEPPVIRRHPDGWRYNVVLETGVEVRKGPSFHLETNGKKLRVGESILINELVTAYGDNVSWLRLKDGRGWVHNIGSDGQSVMIAHSIQHRLKESESTNENSSRYGAKETQYNGIIARLFQSDRT